MKTEKRILTEQEIFDRGIELAGICHQMEVAKDEKKKVVELHNSLIKSLEQRQSELQVAIREGWEECQIEDQEELPFGELPEIHGEVEHEPMAPFGEAIARNPDSILGLPDLSEGQTSMRVDLGAEDAPPPETNGKAKRKGKKGEVSR